MTDKIYLFLGMAKKAGKTVSGNETCEKAIKSKKVYLVIVANDSSNNTKKKFADMCKYRDLKMRVFGNKALVGKYLGKSSRSVVAVVEQGFANRLIQMIDMYDNEQLCGGEHIGQN